MWFRDADTPPNPGVPELRAFIEGVVGCLGAVVEDRGTFGFLWQGAEDLWQASADTYSQDVRPEANRLIAELARLPLSAVRAHGLDGRPLRYKLRVVNAVEHLRPSSGAPGELRDWLRRLLAAIGALLDSLIDAAGGVGGLVRGFKDAVAALA